MFLWTGFEPRIQANRSLPSLQLCQTLKKFVALINLDNKWTNLEPKFERFQFEMRIN